MDNLKKEEKLYRVLSWVSFVVSVVGLFLPLAKSNLAGVTNYNNLGLRPEAANDGIDLIRALDFAGVLKFRVATSGQVVAASGTTYLTNLILRDRDNAVPLIQDTAVTSTIWLTAAQLCDNPRIELGFRTTTGTVWLASSTGLVADCFGGVVGKFAFPITLYNASGTGNFVVLPIANGSSSFHTFAASSTPSNSRATSTLIASSSAHLWIEFVGVSSTGGNWADYTLDVKN